MKLSPHTAGLFVLGDPRWRATLFQGGLAFLMPFVGWYTVLGFRCQLAHRLAHGPDALPPCVGNSRRFLVDGLKSCGVILAYLAPLHVATYALAIHRGFDFASVPMWLPLLVVALPFLLPLTLPISLATFFLDGRLSVPECGAILALFAAVVFVIPAAFLQVSRTGRFRSAFALHEVARLLSQHFGLYVRAWAYSLGVAVLGHVVVPIAPWAIVWGYCAIMFLFNEVLVATSDHGRDGWIVHARSNPQFRSTGRRGARRVRDAAGEDVRVLDLGLFSVPWPIRTS